MGTRSSRRRRRAVPPWFIVWGAVMNIAGLGLLIHEATLPAAHVSWPRLVVYAGMMGGPFAAYADRVRTASEQVRSAVHDATQDPSS